MRDDTPAVYLLAGPAGSAKAAYARTLTDHGVVEVPAGSPSQVASTLIAHMQAGRDAFLDDEHVPSEEWDAYKALVEEHGGQWCLITFTVDHAPLATWLNPASATARD
jgi:hypothetical protein